MSITNRFSRIGIVLLPIALLAVFFKYLHPLNSILHGIEGVGVRKTALILFISFFAIWSILYISFVFFVRITKWVWSDTNSKSAEIQSFSDNSNIEKSLENNMDYQKWAKEKKDEIDSLNKVWEENFPPEKNKIGRAHV